jgi:hypothetical protein
VLPKEKKKKDQKKGYREWSGVDLTPPWWIKANSLRREEWAGSGGFSTVIIIIIKIMIFTTSCFQSNPASHTLLYSGFHSYTSMLWFFFRSFAVNSSMKF